MEKKINTHDHFRQATRRAPQRCGFSLLELLAVMAIMAMLATLAISSYFAAVKGMASRSAKRHFENALVSARQRACIDGVRVSLMAFNEIGGFDSEGNIDEDKLIACYVICKEIGRLSYLETPYLFDEFADLKALFGEAPASGNDTYVSSTYKGGFRLYNLSQGWWTFVEPHVVLEDMGSANSDLLYSKALRENPTTSASVVNTERNHAFKAYAFKMQTGNEAKSSGTGAGNWHIGDVYGVEVSPIQNLPKGFKFDELSDNTKDVQCVTFEPDGSIRGSQVRFTIQGTKASSKERIQFTISNLGKISY